MRWFSHISHMNENRSTRRMYEVRPMEETGKRRPRKTWTHDTRELV